MQTAAPPIPPSDHKYQTNCPNCSKSEFRKDGRDRRGDRDLERPGNRRAGGGDFDRNRSPPPAPAGGMNRERESYKRRASPGSPPPYRRHSPGRRSPPPYKRSRRDEGGGFDGRFGYDHGGGYDRDMGGRLQYGDDRPGRFMGRGPPDMVRGGYRDANSSQREGLISYKQFIQEQEDDILPSEAEHRYQEYKSEYIATQKRTFFAARKDEECLKDKYHPGNLLAVIERRNELAHKVAKDFLLDLQSGTLDIGPVANAVSSNKSGQTNDPNSDAETDADGKRRPPNRGSAKESDLLLPAPKAHPVSSDPRRIQVDIEQTQALIRKLDSEKGIEENILRGADTNIIIIRGLTSVKGLEGIELLDSLLTYLWRVHGVDYYGMIETNEAKSLRHVRGEAKSDDATNNSTEWEKTLDSHWQDRLSGQDTLERQTDIDWDKQFDLFHGLRELMRSHNNNDTCSQVREAGGPNPAQAPADAPSAEPHRSAAQTIGASSVPASADSPDALRLIALTYGSDQSDDDDEENASDQSDDTEWRPADDN